MKIFSVALNLHDHSTYDGVFHNQRERYTRFKRNVPYFDSHEHNLESFNSNVNDFKLNDDFYKEYFKKQKDTILSFSYTNGGIQQSKKILFDTVLKGHEEVLTFKPKKLFDYYLKDDIYYIDHHQSHATYAFINSSFEQSDILAIDGKGSNFRCIFVDKDENIIDLSDKLSLGLIWDKMSNLTGFGAMGGGKLMGLVGYGKHSDYYYDIFESLIEEENTKKENSNYVSSKINVDIKKYGREDLAYTLQKFTIDKIKKYVYPLKSCDNICLSGGVAYNGYMNEEFTKHYENVYVPPAVGDEGQSIGVYQHADYVLNNHKHYSNVFSGKDHKVDPKIFEGSNYKLSNIEEICKEVALAISQGKIVGWYQDKSESGNRALGNRSILADPRDKNIKDKINRTIKKREDFRPFAPSVLEGYYREYFDTIDPSPYMSRICKVKSDKIPGVTHVDNTARIQTVNKDFNKKFYKVIEEFFKITNIPMLLNTSFNCKEPIVETPTDAFKTFNETKLDILVINDYIIFK
jgi:carbamoyltransferase